MGSVPFLLSRARTKTQTDFCEGRIVAATNDSPHRNHQIDRHDLAIPLPHRARLASWPPIDQFDSVKDKFSNDHRSSLADSRFFSHSTRSSCVIKLHHEIITVEIVCSSSLKIGFFQIRGRLEN